MQGIDESDNAEAACWIGWLKPIGTDEDVFQGFLYPASLQMSIELITTRGNFSKIYI